MKKKIALLIVACIACFSLSACSASNNSDVSSKSDDTKVTSDNSTVVSVEEDENTTIEEYPTGESSMSVDEMIEKFQPPGDTIKIDMNADDPSNDEITFTIDGEGKIQNYTYTVNGIKILMTYDYDYPEEGKIWALAFSEDGTVIGERTFEYSKSDDTKGYLEHDGYYFKDIEVFDSTF